MPVTDLVCPYCGGKLYVAMGYDGVYGRYDGDRVVESIDCDNINCGAEWNPDGTASVPPPYRPERRPSRR